MDLVNLLIKFDQFNDFIDIIIDDYENIIFKKDQIVLKTKLVNSYVRLYDEYKDLILLVEEKKVDFDKYVQLFVKIPHLYKQIVPRHSTDVINNLKDRLNLAREKTIRLKILAYPFLIAVVKIQKFWNNCRHNPEFKYCRIRIIRKSGIFLV